MNLSFLECYVKGPVWYVTFGDCPFPPLSKVPCDPFELVHGWTLHFLLLGNTPYGARVPWSVYPVPLMVISDVPRFGLLLK